MKGVTSLRHMVRLLALLMAAVVTPAFAEPDMGKYGRSCAMCHVPCVWCSWSAKDRRRKGMGDQPRERHGCFARVGKKGAQCNAAYWPLLGLQ